MCRSDDGIEGKVAEGDVQGAEGRGRGEGLRRGLKGEVGEYHNESNSCTSSHQQWWSDAL